MVLKLNQPLGQNPLNFKESNIADLIILDLSYSNFKQICPEASKIETYLRYAYTLISNMYSVAKPKGLCCVVAGDDKEIKRNILNPLGTKVVQDIGNWHIVDEIIWVKNNEKSSEDNEYPSIIDYEENPFSQIWILSKDKSVPNRLEFLENSDISDFKKSKLSDSLWHVKPISYEKYHDNLPYELLFRLIESYSKEEDVVVDLISGNCLTGIICKSLNRKFLCLVKKDALQKTEERLSEVRS